MTARSFVDSNVLVYADDRSAGPKRDRARALIHEAMLARTRAALNAGCRVLYSEDLQDGQRIDGLEVVNPFKG